MNYYWQQNHQIVVVGLPLLGIPIISAWLFLVVQFSPTEEASYIPSDPQPLPEKIQSLLWREGNMDIFWNNILDIWFSGPFVPLVIIGFPVQFGINLHLRVFQKVDIPWTALAGAISAFWKTHKSKFIANWTRKTD